MRRSKVLVAKEIGTSKENAKDNFRVQWISGGVEVMRLLIHLWGDEVNHQRETTKSLM